MCILVWNVIYIRVIAIPMGKYYIVCIAVANTLQNIINCEFHNRYVDGEYELIFLHYKN